MGRLLYVSPVVPALSGNGLAMRAGMVLEALASSHEVSLLVVRLYDGPESETPLPLAGLCRRVAVVDPTRALWLFRLRWGRFDIVHAFRLASLPYARQWNPRQLHIDLDDVESLAYTRVAELARANGDRGTAMAAEGQCGLATAAEAESFRVATRIYVCSERDRVAVSLRNPGCHVLTLPNAVRPPAATRQAAEPPRLLFVGTLGYYPNEDAALFICREIAPRLAGACAIEIVGPGATERLATAARAAGVQLTGRVPDVTAAYARATAVVVPIRAGSGTRIKILEAFAHHRPVVSTTLGAEGIKAASGEHLLIADTAESIASACDTLIRDAELASRLAHSAASLVADRYSLDALIRAISPGI